MSFLNKYANKYWKQFCLSVAFVMVEAICDLMQPTIMSKIIDIGVVDKDLNYILRMGSLMLFTTMLGALVASVRNIISSNVSQKLGMEMRSDLYKKIQALALSIINNLDRASLVTRLTNDVTQVQTMVNGLMRISLKAPILCIGSLIMAIQLNPDLAVVLVIVVPLVAVLMAINIKMAFPFFLKVQTALDKLNIIMREYLSGVRVVKAFNKFDYEIEKFNRANIDYQAASTMAMRVMSLFGPGITLTVNLGIISVLWWGGLGVIKGQIQIGHIIAFINYMTQILFSLMIMFMVFNMFVRAKASAGRISEVFLQENSLKSDVDYAGEHIVDTNLKGKVEFENVYFSYEEKYEEPVLKNINLICMPGEFIGIIGSTGSGKSSLVDLIPRFYDVSAGCIKVDGEDIRNIAVHKLREKIAMVPQKTILFSGTVLDNIRWGKEDAGLDEVELAANMAQAHEFIKNFPEGYETKLGQGGVNFSGGQKQRISIARALIKNAEILILDDCTSAVDVSTEMKIKKALKKYAGNLTCFMITQRITSVMDADKIVVLENGNIVGMGKHGELLQCCKVYQEIFQSQVGKEIL